MISYQEIKSKQKIYDNSEILYNFNPVISIRSAIAAAASHDYKTELLHSGVNLINILKLAFLFSEDFTCSQTAEKGK